MFTSIGPLEILSLLPLVVIGFLFAIATSASATQRGHHWLGWFICGLCLGPLALCFALSLQDYRRDVD
ncbi:MAG: hypothetical protein OXG79_04960 [Chloroflexi bacterium]|nr:hypothetical protein [Chloroflexota bacterium]